LKIHRQRDRAYTQTATRVTIHFVKIPSSRVAVLIIDAINDLEFPGAEKVYPWAMKMATRLTAFRAKAHRAGVPVIYANDNYGYWRNDPDDLFKHCMRSGARGRELCRRMKPSREDYLILKPRHSAFFCTPLQPLLQHLGVKELILTGIATNLCVLFTAHDAHMHEYPITVLSDCCAAESNSDHDMALSQLEDFCDARIELSTEVEFARGRKRKGRKP
jgi:nicotinamidase-related amidase